MDMISIIYIVLFLAMGTAISIDMVKEQQREETEKKEEG